MYIFQDYLLSLSCFELNYGLKILILALYSYINVGERAVRSEGCFCPPPPFLHTKYSDRCNLGCSYIYNYLYKRCPCSSFENTIIYSPSAYIYV